MNKEICLHRMLKEYVIYIHIYTYIYNYIRQTIKTPDFTLSCVSCLIDNPSDVKHSEG